MVTLQELKKEREEHLKTIQISLMLAKVAQVEQDERKATASLKSALDESKAEVKMLVTDGKMLIDRVAEEQAKRKAAVKEYEVAKLQYTKWADDTEKEHAYRVTELKESLDAEKTKRKAVEMEMEMNAMIVHDAEKKFAEIGALKAHCSTPSGSRQRPWSARSRTA